jgi:hypothetical protein
MSPEVLEYIEIFAATVVSISALAAFLIKKYPKLRPYLGWLAFAGSVAKLFTRKKNESKADERLHNEESSLLEGSSTDRPPSETDGEVRNGT